MLKHIPALLKPDALHALARMGHVLLAEGIVSEGGRR
jgi:L-fucose mutarotase/ribose pyranase (RbsD/FucU family)